MNKQPWFGDRSTKRFQVCNCWIQLKPKGFLGRFRKEFYNLSLVDLSTSGLQGISAATLKDKKEYDIAILAPAFRTPIWAEGRIVWSKPYTAGDIKQCYRIGVEFTFFQSHAINKIEHLECNPSLREITWS